MKASRHKTDNVDPSQFAPGQRWVSEMQAEFGLALILQANNAQVQVHYPAVSETITYSARNAPLRRVVFEEGDTVKDQEGNSFVVVEVVEENKVLSYIGKNGQKLAESALSDTMSVQRPEQRLLSGVSDHPRLWSLRQSALRNRSEARSSEVRGLVGGRISLIPHQLFIAEDVSNRHAPRVLLADEVGLGKTIEACLILQRLHINKRAKRVIILLPDALVNQWFVELYRRFSMTFSIYDEERAVSIETEGRAAADDGESSDVNPFFDDQFIICAISWLAENPKRAAQAAAAEWDLTIVDEAHHLEWTQESSSPEYDMVAAIAEKSEGLLLLTATPEQLGREGHFARLRLLDPVRFSDLAEFIEESDHFQNISQLADHLNSDKKLTKKALGELTKLLGEESVASLKADDIAAHRAACRAELIDLHGTGRVLFRNRRLVLRSFPKRIAEIAPLNCEEGKGFETKMDWLVKTLKSHEEEKFLLIVHSREMAIEIEEALRERISSQAAIFHEELSLLQRDKNAAWFGQEDGARLLICSEIGSEGRNFQFAHHLVLFDLPSEPGLLEQRVGRLDRIGQTEDIHIHVPFIEGSGEELMTMWYHNGLGAFEHTLHGSQAVSREFRDELKTLLESTSEERETALPDLLDRTRAFKEKVDHDLEEGRDHLLEISSFDPDQGQALISQIENLDEDERLESLMLKLCDHFGVTVEDLDDRCYLLLPEHLFSAEAFPGLPEDGLSVTFDRSVALAREDITFLSADHPMVISAIDSVISTDHGNAAFFKMEKAGEQLLMIETVSVLECIAPDKYHADRFLPPQPIRQLVDQHGKNRSEDFSVERIRSNGRPGPGNFLREKSKALKATVPNLLKAAELASEDRGDELRSEAVEAMTEAMDVEIHRLERLKEMGHPVRESEIATAKDERDALKKYLADAPLRLDSVRLILASP